MTHSDAAGLENQQSKLEQKAREGWKEISKGKINQTYRIHVEFEIIGRKCFRFWGKFDNQPVISIKKQTKRNLKNNEANINAEKNKNLYKKGNRITVHYIVQMSIARVKNINSQYWWAKKKKKRQGDIIHWEEWWK